MAVETPISWIPRRRAAGGPPRPSSPPLAAPQRLTASVRELERVETEAWRSLLSSAPHAIRVEARLGVARVGGLLAASAAACDVLAFNRVIGRDPGAAVDGETLDRLVAHYRSLGVRRAFLPWPPAPPAAPARGELERRGIRRYNRWIKLWRDASPAPPVRTSLRAVRLTADGRGECERVLAATFDWPPPLAASWAALVGRPGWHHYAVRHRGRAVAVAGMLLRAGSAWFGPAATLPEHRGRGAQTLLLRQRIEAARAAGCRQMVVETAEPAAGRVVVSLRNVLRAGFEIAYRRENYLITPCTDDGNVEESAS